MDGKLPSFMSPNTGSTIVNLIPDQIAQLQTLLVSMQIMLAFQASASVSQPSPQAIPVSSVPNLLQYIPTTFLSPSFPLSFAFGNGTSHRRHLNAPDTNYPQSR